MTACDLAVVVGTYNRQDRLRACVESVLKQSHRLFRLYITDAGSTDGTIEYLKGLDDPRAEAVLVGEKLGQARAYNDVFRRLDCRYVAWLSDDNVVVDNGLDQAVAILDQEPAIGMVGLKVKDRAGPFTAAPYIGGISAAGILNVNQGMLRSRLMNDLGGFDETFRDYGIDPDLTARVLLAGYEVVYTRNVALHHYRDWAEPGSGDAYQAHQRRLETSLARYADRYGDLDAGGPGLAVKAGFGRFLRAIFGSRLAPNGDRPVLGQLPRDWHNIFKGRYIDLFDSYRCRLKPYHLRQKIPARARKPISLEPKQC